MPFNMKPWEFLIIVALILLLFGAKRLPDAARGLGRSLRIFKAETKALHDDDGPDEATTETAGAQKEVSSIADDVASPDLSAPASRTQPERTES